MFPDLMLLSCVDYSSFLCVASWEACKEMSATSLPTCSVPNTASVMVLCT